MEQVKEIDIVTKRYDIGDGFFIEITETPTHYESYIFRELSGIKLMVSSTEKTNMPFELYVQLTNKDIPGAVREYFRLNIKGS